MPSETGSNRTSSILLTLLKRPDAYRQPPAPRNTSPPSAPTAANHASNCPHKHPASAESPSHSESPKTSHSDPDTCPSPPTPAPSSSSYSGSRTNHPTCP